jgi:hypothetical protein
MLAAYLEVTNKNILIQTLFGFSQGPLITDGRNNNEM